VSLTFQCLNGCIAGYKLLNIALHLGKHAAHFTVLCYWKRVACYPGRSRVGLLTSG
jgi:hypothetical protein